MLGHEKKKNCLEQARYKMAEDLTSSATSVSLNAHCNMSAS